MKPNLYYLNKSKAKRLRIKQEGWSPVMAIGYHPLNLAYDIAYITIKDWVGGYGQKPQEGFHLTPSGLAEDSLKALATSIIPKRFPGPLMPIKIAGQFLVGEILKDKKIWIKAIQEKDPKFIDDNVEEWWDKIIEEERLLNKEIKD